MKLSSLDRAVLDALLPPGAHPALPLGLWEAGFERFHAEFQETSPASLRALFKAGLWAAAWVSPLLIRRAPPLSRHGLETRERALAAMGESRSYVLRQLFLVLKTVASFCYGAHPAVRLAVGYPRQEDASREAPWA